MTEKVVQALPKYDLVILNFANPDMVGHTGVVEAGIKAVETIDDCVKAVVEKTLSLGGKLFITADHGNCEQMRDRDGRQTPRTRPTLCTSSMSRNNPVVLRWRVVSLPMCRQHFFSCST